jgi:hypothetical protein
MLYIPGGGTKSRKLNEDGILILLFVVGRTEEALMV